MDVQLDCLLEAFLRGLAALCFDMVIRAEFRCGAFCLCPISCHTGWNERFAKPVNFANGNFRRAHRWRQGERTSLASVPTAVRYLRTKHQTCVENFQRGYR